MTLNTKQHTSILVQLLKDIFTDPTLGPFLGFKGGTAAMLFYGLTRFSVDLDFDLLDLSKESSVFQQMNTVLKAYGTVKEARNKRYNLFFVLAYDQKQDEACNIKIEINKRTFGSSYEIKQYLGIPLKVMVKKDMLARKLVALNERMGKVHRDIFDVWFMLKNQWPINKEIIERHTQLPYEEFLQKTIEALEKLNNRGIISGLGELLNDQQKAWTKAHLKEETLFLLKLELMKA